LPDVEAGRHKKRRQGRRAAARRISKEITLVAFQGQKQIEQAKKKLKEGGEERHEIKFLQQKKRSRFLFLKAPPTVKVHNSVRGGCDRKKFPWGRQSNETRKEEGRKGRRQKPEGKDKPDERPL